MRVTDTRFHHRPEERERLFSATRPKPRESVNGQRPKPTRATARPKPQNPSQNSSGVAVALAIIAGMSSAALWFSGYGPALVARAQAQTHNLMLAAGLIAQSVEVRGAKRADVAAILTELDAHDRVPITELDLNAAKARIETVAWVRSANILRLMPDRLLVLIEERRPLARWRESVDGPVMIIDQEGAVIAGASANGQDHLVLVLGPGADRAAPDLIAALNERPTFAVQVASATRVGNRRWDLHLASGMVANLPEGQPTEGVEQLYQLAQSEGFLDWPLKRFDVRHGVVMLPGVGEEAPS